MPDTSLLTLVSEFFRQDPFRALGLMGLACLAVSMTTNFDLLHALGFTSVPGESGEAKVV